jgi:hypothetical protein
MTYRACPASRERRTKADISAICDAIIEVIEDDPPMTVRQVFYQLVTRGTIEKSEEQYQGTVIRLMTEMRLDGSLPYSWVVDESRRVRITRTYDSIEHALEQTARFYRRSALEQSASYIEVWVEKDALAGVMWDATSDYDVPLMVSRGMPSLTFLHSSALAIKSAAERGKSAYIYQFGDHDPSGVLIPQTIKRRLNEMCMRLDVPAPIVKRVALTEKQIERYHLPTRPTKRDGNRHAAGFVGRSVELDALPPRVLRDLVSKVIERHISPAATAALRVAEDSERELLRAWPPRRKAVRS